MIKVIFDKVLSIIYMLYLKAKMNNKEVNTNRILIIIGGHMGNGLLILDSLFHFSDYLNSEGKEADVICERGIWKIINEYVDCSKINYIEDIIGGSERLRLKDLKRINKVMQNKEYDIIINTLNNNNIYHFIATCTRSNRRVSLKEDCKRKKSIRSIIERLFVIGYTYFISVPVNLHEIMRYRLLFEYIGVPHYTTKVFTIKAYNTSVILPNNHYITIAIDSMNTKRRWRLINFSELVKHLLHDYNYDICLTGTKVNETEFQTLFRDILEDHRVHSYIGKTSFFEWLDLLSHSQFHIGVDSGSIHFATSVGVQSYCITGVWDGHRVFPYCVEKTEGNKMPICIYRSDIKIEELHCFACKIRGYDFGTNNKKCRKMCLSGCPCECLNKVTVEDVLNAIENGERINQSNVK